MRKFIVFVVIVILAIIAIDRWNDWRRARPAKFTPAEGSKLRLEDVRVLAALDSEYTKLVEAVVPSVVAITTTQRLRRLVDPFEEFFDLRRRFRQPPSVQGPLGSGVIVSKEGHILTNNHVIANVDEVRVQLNDGRTAVAKVLGSDEQSDIAILKIDLPNLVPLPFGDSDKVKVGQLAFAVGNPFGFHETVTHGIISARRGASEDGHEFFQTDTPINPGNSGGPLVNLQGEMIGINSAIFSGSGGWQGVGFAIPSNVALETLESLLKRGRVVRGYLGIIMQELTPELGQQFGASKGALVTAVIPDSPAEKAGIRSGDVITKIDGKAVANMRQLRARVSRIDVGSNVKLGMTRNGKNMQLTAQIEEQPVQVPLPRAPAQRVPQQPMQAENALTGVDVAEIPPGHRPMLPPNVDGVMVARLDADAPAARVLRVGDVIEEINQQPVRSVEDYREVVGSLAPDEKLLLFIARGRTRLYVVIPQ